MASEYLTRRVCEVYEMKIRAFGREQANGI